MIKVLNTQGHNVMAVGCKALMEIVMFFIYEVATITYLSLWRSISIF